MWQEHLTKHAHQMYGTRISICSPQWLENCSEDRAMEPSWNNLLIRENPPLNRLVENLASLLLLPTLVSYNALFLAGDETGDVAQFILILDAD